MPPGKGRIELGRWTSAIWRQAQDRLGCPVDVYPVSTYFAQQPFGDRGHMYWSQLHDRYFVLIADPVGSDQGIWLVFEASELPAINYSGTACDPDIPAEG